MKKDNIFDPYDESTIAKGVDPYVDLANICPVYHYNGRFDFYISSDYNDILNSILKDNTTWTIENGSSPKPLPPELRVGLVSDNDRHLQIRRVVQRGFSSVELERLGTIVDRLADELIDAMAARPEGGGDIFELLFMPLPARLMCLMLGVPEIEFLTYKNWADEYFYSILNDAKHEWVIGDSESVAKPVFDILAERRAMLAEMRLEPGLELVGTVLPDDFLSRFMCDKVNGEYISDLEILNLALGFVLGGNETTMMLMSNLLWRLLEDRQRWETVKSNPQLLEAAIEESLRLDPPVIGLFRSPRHDVELQGCPIAKDAKVMYNVVAANRNPEIWPNPDEFRLDRNRAAAKRHIAFSSGSHTCLGAPLARMEVRQVFEKLVARLPNLRMAGEPVPAPGFNIHGKVRLPVMWN